MRQPLCLIDHLLQRLNHLSLGSLDIYFSKSRQPLQQHEYRNLEPHSIVLLGKVQHTVFLIEPVVCDERGSKMSRFRL